MDQTYPVTVAAGSARSSSPTAVAFPHRWTDTGVTVEAGFTGAHLLHLAAAGCVLNDVYREAAALGVDVDGVRVTAHGGFDIDTWTSTGVRYVVEVDTGAGADALAAVLTRVDAVAEIPRALRHGTTVTRTTTG